MPSVEIEEAFRREIGVRFVAGIDEVGRGAIAGPVVAAAVILPLEHPESLKKLAGVNDSKQLTPATRVSLFDLIIDVAISFGIGSIGPEWIDEVGIIPANAAAMGIAVNQLDPPAECLLIDGRMRLKDVPLPQRSIIHGDRLSLSIAAASILAKVHRDNQMIDIEGLYPEFGFSSHKGYCTPGHVHALSLFGPTPIHRYSFAPLRLTLL